MNENELAGVVLRIVLSEVAKQGEYFVPVTSSNRHVHLCQPDVERLFGAGYRLTKLRDLAQPGQYACNESVTMICDKGTVSLRVVGPARRETQIELSYTDCYKLGVKPVLRMSGETAGTPGCVLENAGRRVTLECGVIVAARHLHMAAAEAAAYGLKDGDRVSLVAEGPRASVLGEVVVRSGEGHSLEAHIDKDEANACGIQDGMLCRILLPNTANRARHAGVATAIAEPPTSAASPSVAGMPSGPLQTYVPHTVRQQPGTLFAPAAQPQTYAPPAHTQAPAGLMDLSGEPRRLIAEEDVLLADRQKQRYIRHAEDAIITPLARDAASARGIELIPKP